MSQQTEELTHIDKIRWMIAWSNGQGLKLSLEGSCGFGRECVGIIASNSSYPEYHWSGPDGRDSNGNVWSPNDAYHKVDCVAVLGHGEEAEGQLYDWLKWFDDNGFEFESGYLSQSDLPAPLAEMLGRDQYVRMVKR